MIYIELYLFVLGIFIPETRRFFVSSHSGLWKFCRNTITPTALPNANVVRNITSIAFQNPNVISEAKNNCSHLPFIKEFKNEIVDAPMVNFTEAAKRRMFAHWVLKDEMEFQTFKKAFHDLVLSTPEAKIEIDPIDAKPIPIDPLNVSYIEGNKIFGKALQKVVINGSAYNFVIPEMAQAAIFEGWSDKRYVPRLFWPYARDLGLPAFVLNEERVILQLMPPYPPKKGNKANGYEYTYTSKFENKIS